MHGMDRQKRNVLLDNESNKVCCDLSSFLGSQRKTLAAADICRVTLSIRSISRATALTLGKPRSWKSRIPPPGAQQTHAHRRTDWRTDTSLTPNDACRDVMIKHASVLPVSTNEMMKERRTRHESQDHIGPCCLMSGASSQYSWRFVLENENTFVKKCAAAL